MQKQRFQERLEAWQEALWLLIALVTPLFVNFWVEQQFEASKIWLLRALVALLVVGWLGGWVVGNRPKPLPPPVLKLVIALALIPALATILSVNRPIALFGSLDRANGYWTHISYLLLFGCVATQLSAERSRLLIKVITLTALPICLLGLAQALGWQPLSLTTDARSLLTTTLGRANFTSAYLALLLPLTLVAAQAATSRGLSIGYGTLFVLEIAVIVLTQARAASIAAAVGIAVLFWLRHAPDWTRRMRWLSALGMAVVLAGTLVLFLQRGAADGGSIAARWTIWQASLRLLWPRLWLGYGADTLELVFPSVYPPQLVYYQGRGVVVDRAHNWLLDWALSYGVVATAAFLALAQYTLRAGWRRLAQTTATAPSDGRRLEPRWIAASMAAICAHLIGNLFLFDVAATAVVFWLLLAVVTAATMTATAQTDAIQTGLLPRRCWLHSVIMATVVGCAIGAVWLGSVRPLLADLHSWRGTQALSRGDALAALARYETATRYQPHRAPYRVALALTDAQLGRFEKAQREMQVAIGLRPTDPVLLRQLAAVYARQALALDMPSKLALAYAAYEQAIALAPTIAVTYQEYADLALRAGDDTIALTQATQAVTLDATDGVSFGIIGWAQLQAENVPAALGAFEQAVRWLPDSADFQLGLATAHFMAGNDMAARLAVAQSLRIDPTYAPALALQRQLDDD